MQAFYILFMGKKSCFISFKSQVSQFFLQFHET
jgi:hypothetical protein